MTEKILRFLIESNGIEGIHRAPYQHEITHAVHFMLLPGIGLRDLNEIQACFAPGHRLRDEAGLDVQVGEYIAPCGGPAIVPGLADILADVAKGYDPWKTHVAFEMLHPYTDGNGRTGRILWAWHMKRMKRDPFALPFLHRFYYQTLEAQG